LPLHRLLGLEKVGTYCSKVCDVAEIAQQLQDVAVLSKFEKELFLVVV
jgi:hypothetical protein